MSRLGAAGGRTFDVLIVGGGIIGAGIVRDAALRGLDVALFEKADFGGGTTAGSTRLVHGGLRYLEMLDFRLVRMDLRERETLLRIAPHLVKPLEFFVPVYGRNPLPRWNLRVGMVLYDLLSYDKSLPRHRWLSRDALMATEPHLASEKPSSARPLQGAAAYYDAQVAMPERLCLENILDARAQGASTFNHAEVLDALRELGGRVVGLRVRDTLTGDTTEVRGKVVVNASGPWFDRVAGRLTSARAPRVRTTKGVHVACPPVIRHAVVLTSPLDGRLFFAIPWLGYTWIGTTDTDFTDDPADARATGADVDYLMRSARAFLPVLDATPIVFTNAGVRALVMKGGAASSVSRLHAIRDEAGAPGLISVLGGKITGYRAIAEEATDRVCRVLGSDRPGRTAARPLPGAEGDPGDLSSLHPQVREHLASLYGTRAAQVAAIAAADPSLAAQLSPSTPDIAAQVVFSVRTEQCLRVADFLLRRTSLGFSADQGQAAAPRVATLMAAELGWSSSQADAELERYRHTIATTQAFRHERA